MPCRDYFKEDLMRYTEESDYVKYRGKCREFCDELIKSDPTLILVRGYFHCVFDGKQPHWWCKKPDGTIVDPTIRQFTSKGIAGEYEEFDGNVECSECGKIIPEEEAQFDGNGHYAYCSDKCHMRHVGLY